MKEAYEIELKQITASFVVDPFDMVLGIERQSGALNNVTKPPSETGGFTEDDWQIVYARVLVEDRWYFLPQTLYDAIDDTYSDEIGNLIWKLTRRL